MPDNKGHGTFGNFFYKNVFINTQVLRVIGRRKEIMSTETNIKLAAWEGKIDSFLRVYDGVKKNIEEKLARANKFANTPIRESLFTYK